MIYKMWRIAKSFARGLRSVRPSQYYSQECCDDGGGGGKHYYHDISEVQAATLKYYSVSSCWSPLTVKDSHSTSPAGIRCSLRQRVRISHLPISQVCEKDHGRSPDKGTPQSDRTVIASRQPKCPPWLWVTLQDGSNLQGNRSENEGKEEKETRNESSTFWYEEWKEILHASPTLHALGWGSAAALTWSLLYYNFEQHHTSHYKKKQLYLSSQTNNTNLNLKTFKNENNDNEEILAIHKPYEYFYSSESRDDGNNKTSTKCNKDGQLNTKNIFTNLVGPHIWQTQEMIVPIYSLKHKFFEKVKEWFGTKNSHYFREEYKLEEIYQDQEYKLEEIYQDQEYKLKETYQDQDDVEASTIHKCLSGQEKADSGCLSDSNDSLHTHPQTCTPKTHVQDSYVRREDVKGNVKTPSDIGSSSWDATETSEYFLGCSRGEEHESYDQSRENLHPLLKNSDDGDGEDIKILSDKLLKIVKAHHEERLSHMLGKEEDKKKKKSIFDTDPEEMIVYLQAAVLMGDLNSAFNLALCYHTGHGVSRDVEKARKLYEVASGGGHGWATYNLAVILNQEFDLPSTHPKVHSLLVQAAKMGVREAEDALSALLEEEEEERRRNIQHRADDDDGGGASMMRRCNSEPSLSSSSSLECYPYSYSSSDLQSLILDADYSSSTHHHSSVAKVSLRV